MKHDVAVVAYKKPLESLRKAVDLAGGLSEVRGASSVFIKPNLCIWHEGVSFPKYGVLTTARLIEDMVVLLKEHGVEDITIGEGVAEYMKKGESTLDLIARGMGLDLLAERYGLKIVDVHRGAFTRLEADGVTLSVNRDFLEADYTVNLAVLKTHAFTQVSLGIKNLKGLINTASRKKCHARDPRVGLDYHVSKLALMLSPSLTVLDGIYTCERGPIYSGDAHRSDLIVASKDLVSVDKVGAKLLGVEPSDVPHLAMAARGMGREIDLSDVDIRGDVDMEAASKPHGWAQEMTESGDMPLALGMAGIKGFRFPEADDSLCTYCAEAIVCIPMAAMMAQNNGQPYDDVEVLHGKRLEPTMGYKHTLLVGQCQVKKNGRNPLISHCVTIDGCPPDMTRLPEACAEVGIELPDGFMATYERSPELFHMSRYVGRPEFDESFYTV